MRPHAPAALFAAINDARRVAYKLGIPHYVMNFREAFRETVIDNFIEEYRKGRTPKPACAATDL